MENQGIIYVVALPIGNHLDIGERAKATLEYVDTIAAEDTRVLNVLNQDLRLKLKHLVSHHEHNEESSTKGLLEIIRKGQNLALVCDAGTPGVSDPGFRLVKEAIAANIRLVPIPGPSALTALLSICPIGGGNHFFAGFPPNKSTDRKKLFKKLNTLHGLSSKIIFYESPHRILEHLQDALDVWGTRRVFILREISKKFEEYFFLSIEESIEIFLKQSPKGEFVLAYDFGPPIQIPPGDSPISIEDQIQKLIDQGFSSKDIQNKLANDCELSKKDLYQKIQELKSR